MLTKAKMREEVLRQRNRLNKSEISAKSRLIFENIKGMQEFQTAKVIMAFMSTGSEVKTDEFIAECIHTGKRMVIPSVVTGEGKRHLAPYEINDLVKDVGIGTYGIREPRGGAIPLENRSIIDMVIVPGVVFGRNMHRIGYGKGFYDGFLGSMKDVECVKVGVCFDLQLVNEIPAEAHDVPLDVIVTEKEVFRRNRVFKRGGRDEK